MFSLIGFGCTVLVAACGLAWCAQRRGLGDWGVTRALIEGEANAPRFDLRFLVFTAGITLELVAVALLPTVRTLAFGLRLLVFGLGLPVLVLGVAACADGLRLSWALARERWGREPRLNELVREAERRLGDALERTEDQPTREVLLSLSETLEGYRDVSERETSTPELRAKVQGLLALTESCLKQELNAPLLEAKSAASHEEVRKVYESLARAYRGAQEAEPTRFRGITQAYRRLIRRARAA